MKRHVGSGHTASAREQCRRCLQTRSGAPRIAAPLILFATCLGCFTAQIDTSVVTLALRRMGDDLGIGVAGLQAVVDSYNVAYASFLLTGGTLGDLYGRRRVLIAGFALFVLGSAASGFAPGPGLLIAGRAVSGLGAALLVPTSLAILAVAYPDPARRGRAIGIWAACNGLAFALGPTVGGWLVEAGGWRSIFLVIVPVSALGLALAWTSVPESSDPEGRRLDLAGQALAITALAALTLVAIEAPHWGWASAPTLGAIAVFRRGEPRLRRGRAAHAGRDGAARSAGASAPFVLDGGRVLHDLRHVRHAVPHAALFSARAR